MSHKMYTKVLGALQMQNPCIYLLYRNSDHEIFTITFLRMNLFTLHTLWIYIFGLFSPLPKLSAHNHQKDKTHQPHHQDHDHDFRVAEVEC